MASILEAIADALRTVDERVYYGTAAQHKAANWDYTVFSRASTARVGERTGLSELYEVAVVREGHVPEGTLEAVVAAMEAIPGVRLASRGVEYAYEVKPKTDVTVEMMLLTFARGRKG